MKNHVSFITFEDSFTTMIPLCFAHELLMPFLNLVSRLLLNQLLMRHVYITCKKMYVNIPHCKESALTPAELE